MTVSEIKKQVKDMTIELQNKAIEKLRAILLESGIKLTECKVCTPNDCDGYKIEYEFEYNDFKQQDYCFWAFSDDIETVATHIMKNILYIDELRNKFPEFALLNDYIQAHREFNKIIELEPKSYGKINCELTSYLKLPNSTKCCHGGGDYEIQRTPQRVEIFKHNITTLINCFLDNIAELRGIEKGLEELEKSFDKKD